MVRFIHTLSPCVLNDVTLWHLQHGWIYDVQECRSGRLIGVFFVTLLCGDGGIVHFDTLPGAVSPPLFLSALRLCIPFVSRHLDNIFATIPADRTRLIRLVKRIGFRDCPDASFLRDGRRISLLKYFGPDSHYIILKAEKKTEDTERKRRKTE